MTIPAMIYLALMAIGLLGSAYEHGKPRTGNYSFGIAALAKAIAFGLLYWGGFFAMVKP